MSTPAPPYGQQPQAYNSQQYPYYMAQPGYPPPDQAFGQPGNVPPVAVCPPYPPPTDPSSVVTSFPPPMQQPMQYVPSPAFSNPAIPQGLEYLTMVDQLLVKQKVELLEAFTGFETNNKYTVKNSMGQHVYYAVEDNDCCTRNCLGSLRPFTMKIFDNQRSEVLTLSRPFRCESCCCPCFLQEIEVISTRTGQLLGSVTQNWSIFCPKFTVRNSTGDAVLRISGPFCTFSICGDVSFEVLSLDEQTKVGKITKQWSGLAREMFTDADYFGVTFPLDLDVNIKAVLLAATFLIDFMFFEKTGNKENDGIGML